jgi:hypothetical protein
MAGRMGGENGNIQNTRVLKVVAEEESTSYQRCVPGHNNSYVIVTSNGSKKINGWNFNGKRYGRKVQLSDSVFAIEPKQSCSIYLDVSNIC